MYFRKALHLGQNLTFNFEGRICHADGRDGKTVSYLQVFRNGCLEAVDDNCLSMGEDGKQWHFNEENKIIASLKRYLELLRHLYVNPPFFVMLSMLGIKGHWLYWPGAMGPSGGRKKLDRNELIFPEEFVSSHDADCYALLRRSFTMLWQAVGEEGSPNYNRKGN